MSITLSASSLHDARLIDNSENVIMLRRLMMLLPRNWQLVRIGDHQRNTRRAVQRVLPQIVVNRDQPLARLPEGQIRDHFLEQAPLFFRAGQRFALVARIDRLSDNAI